MIRKNLNALIKTFTLTAGIAASSLTMAGETWVLVGDSIVTTPEDTTTGMIYLLAQNHNVDVRLISSPGQIMTGPARNSIPPAIEFIHGGLHTVNKVVIALGTNDWAMPLWGVGIPLTSFSSSYAEFLDKIPEDIAVYCVTPIGLGDETGYNLRGKMLQDFRNEIHTVCDAAGATTIDGTDLFPVANDTDYTSDEVHLTATGVAKYAEWMWTHTR